MVYPLVDFLFVVQHDKRLGGDGVAVENETEVATLTLHVCEIYQGSVQSTHTHMHAHTHTHIQRVGLVREQMKGEDSQTRKKETQDDSKTAEQSSTLATVSKL